MKLFITLAALALLSPIAAQAANGVTREDATRPESPVFVENLDNEAPQAVFGTFYNYKNVSGGGASYNAHTATLAYWQPLDIIHTQYFMLSGNSANFK